MLASVPSVRLADSVEPRFWQGVQDAERFFMGEAQVQKALEKLVRTLDEYGIPYAIIGAMALNEFGYRRMTAPDRLEDLADVIELIRAVDLPEALAADLDPDVREKYLDLWRAAQARSSE